MFIHSLCSHLYSSDASSGCGGRAGSGAANNGNGSGVPYNGSGTAGCNKSLFGIHIKLYNRPQTL